MPKKVTIELTETQARTVLAAVEEWFRLRLGQPDNLANDLACLKYGESDFDKVLVRRNAIDELIRAMFRIAWPYVGVPREVPPYVHVASDIWSTLRYELGPKTEQCSTPFQMGPEPLPKITVEETE